jgi:hypothetical protein
MKNFIIILIFITTTPSSYSQKKEYYVDDDLNYISKSEFERKSTNELDYNLRFELDTSFINIKVLRIKKGKIKLSLLDSIKMKLENYGNQKINSEDKIFINYYPGNDDCSSNGYKTNFKNQLGKYFRKIKKMKNVKHFFVFKSNDEIEKFGNKFYWQPDMNNLIENTFYPIPYPCGGYVIIDSKGNYISQRGEYCYSNKLIKEIKTFANNTNKN